MPKSRKRKEKFRFLKQILEDASDKENDGKKSATESSTKTDGSVQTETEKKGKNNAGPVGIYPVSFKKSSKNKCCQTRLSSFPLFRLPEDTEWISDEEGDKKKKSIALKKKKKQSKSVAKDSNKDHVLQEDSEDERLPISKVKNSDGSRKNFRSEHQLKETNNPILQAWLHKKSIVARKQRKLERKEKRAKRAALEEEARIQAERAEESNEKVGDWFKRKRKEARVAWRKGRTRVSPHQVDTKVTSRRGDTFPQPPPEYRVVRSFKCAKSSAGHMTDNALDEESNSAFQCISSNNATDKLYSENKTDLDANGDSNVLEKNTADHVKRRPKTAVNSTENDPSSQPKTVSKRPKTSRERSLKNSATTTSTSNKKMQLLSYDQWLRVKRDGDKERVIQKKRELIDSHLEAVIKELGKKRVEKIMSPRKQVDTGLKNFSRSPHPDCDRTVNSKPKKDSPYRWILSKKPRPEPQGCDCPESQGADRTNATSCQQRAKNDGDSTQDANVMVKSSEQPKVRICQEVDDKYNELKPSIQKVKDILDSEIRKLKESRKGLDNSCSQQTIHVHTSDSSLTSEGDSSVNKPKLSRPVSARPPSARPTTAHPPTAKPSSAHLTKEQAKKIASDLDVLGLCDSEPDEEEINTKTDDTKSTVRENYFDYGSDSDPPTMKSAGFVQ